MSYADYEQDLYAIYKSEVTGEALFATAAALTFGDRSKKWSALAALETQTRLRYLAFVGEDRALRRYPLTGKIAGHILGLILILLPWRRAMTLLLTGVPQFIAVFSRLVDNSSDTDRAFFEYVLEHEKAIEEFSTLELRGDAGSLDPVQRLLSPAG